MITFSESFSTNQMSHIWDDAAALVIVIFDKNPVHYQTVKVLQSDFVEVSQEPLMNFLVMFGVICALHLLLQLLPRDWTTLYSLRVIWKLVNCSPTSRLKSVDHCIRAQYLVFGFFVYLFIIFVAITELQEISDGHYFEYEC